jgi:hypothetical protein
LISQTSTQEHTLPACVGHPFNDGATVAIVIEDHRRRIATDGILRGKRRKKDVDRISPFFQRGSVGPGRGPCRGITD